MSSQSDSKEAPVSPTEALLLWDLLITGEQPAMSKTKPGLERTKREILVKKGFINLEKRGQPTHILLTEKARKCALDDLIVDGTQSPYAATAFQHLIEKLREYLKCNDISLEEFLNPQNKAAADSDKTFATPEDLEEKIREAYSKVSEGNYNVRVRLSELRQYLGDLPRTEIDEKLGEMELAGKLSLMPLDDPQEIHPEDEKAAIDLGGPKRHILYMKG